MKPRVAWGKEQKPRKWSKSSNPFGILQGNETNLFRPKGSSSSYKYLDAFHPEHTRPWRQEGPPAREQPPSFSTSAPAAPLKVFRLQHQEGSRAFLPSELSPVELATPRRGTAWCYSSSHSLHQGGGEAASWKRKLNLQLRAAAAKAIAGA